MLLKTLVNKITEYPALPDRFISSILDYEDRKPEKDRAATYNGFVHVSSLAYDFCPRQYAIAHHEKLNLYKSFTGGHKVTWKLGRAAEQHVREAFIEGYGKSNVYAKWLCSCGKKYYEGLGSKTLCECGKPFDIFAEPDIKSDEFAVTGHPDLIVRYQKFLHVIEIKSIKSETTTTTGWKDLEAPLHSHVMQAGLYPYLLANKVENVSPIVTFLYVTKDFKFGSPYKEFTIDTRDEQYVKLRDSLLLEAKQVKDYVKDGVSPPRICPSLSSNLAKKCPVAFRCFHAYGDEII